MLTESGSAPCCGAAAHGANGTPPPHTPPRLRARWRGRRVVHVNPPRHPWLDVAGSALEAADALADSLRAVAEPVVAALHRVHRPPDRLRYHDRSSGVGRDESREVAHLREAQ